MVLTILIILLVLLLFLGAYMLLRTLTYGEIFEPVEPADGMEVDADAVAEHLAALVRCETISSDARQPKREPFLKLHQALEQFYPRLHSQLEREVLQNFSLLYTWKGKDPNLEPVLLAAHQDVVPADPATLKEWEHPPFSGKIVDGYVWGRGTMDIKSQLVAIMEAVEGLIRSGYQPDRTIYLAFGHDEEAGGHHGANQIANHLEKKGVQLSAVLDEGGMVLSGFLPGITLPVAMIGIAEKGYLSLEFSVESPPGHSSMPPAQTAIGTLSRALSRVEANPLPARLGPIQPFLRAVSVAAPFQLQTIFANLWLLSSLFKYQMARNPQTNAAIRTTTALTMISGGIKDNILPHQARALVNFRLLPGNTIAEVCEYVRKTIKDPRVHFEPVEGGAWEALPASPSDTPAFAALAHTIRQFFGNIPVAPNVVPGATDARYYTRICENVYRFTPMQADSSDLRRVHGINERIPVDSLARMVKFFGMLIQDWAGAEPEIEEAEVLNHEG